MGQNFEKCHILDIFYTVLLLEVDMLKITQSDF